MGGSALRGRERHVSDVFALRPNVAIARSRPEIYAKFFILCVTPKNQRASVLSVRAVHGFCVGTLSPGAGLCCIVIEPEKKDAGSPSHLAERRVLPAAEWVWREKRRFPKSDQELFAAQFVLGKDPGERADVAEDANRSDRGESLTSGATGSCTPVVTQRGIIARESAFQTRLRGWLLSE